MTIGQVKATIRMGAQTLSESGRAIEKVGADLTDTSALALATLHDSSHELANKARHTLAEAQREIDLTLRWVNAAKKHASSYLSALG